MLTSVYVNITLAHVDMASLIKIIAAIFEKIAIKYKIDYIKWHFHFVDFYKKVRV